MDGFLQYIGFLAGLTLSAVSTSLGLIGSFNGNFLISNFAMMGVVIGIEVVQRSFDDKGLFERLNLRRLILFITGCSLMGSGFTLIFEGNPAYISALGGAMVIIGFIPAHEGVDRNVI